MSQLIEFFRPFRALILFCSLPQGGARFTSLALGYFYVAARFLLGIL